MKRRLFNMLAGLSLLLCVATPIADFASHVIDLGHWVYFATDFRGPSVVDGTIEFGSLGTQQPFVRTQRSLSVGGYSWGGPYPYGQAAKAHKFHDMDDNFARSIVWNVGGISETVGRIIPPWGWKAWPTDPNGSWGIPTVAIPYREYDVPVAYLMLLFALAPAVWLKRKRLETRRLRSGLCPTCGYDLRATPAQCPECGTIPGKIAVHS